MSAHRQSVADAAGAGFSPPLPGVGRHFFWYRYFEGSVVQGEKGPGLKDSWQIAKRFVDGTASRRHQAPANSLAASLGATLRVLGKHF